MLKKGSSSQILLQNNYDKAVMMLHCFRNTPKILNELSLLLYKNNFSIYNMRLPGHGLINEDEILNIKRRDWEIYTENILFDILDRYNQVSLIGLSMGATLSLRLLLKYGSAIKKAVLLSPFLKPRQKNTWTSPILSIFKKKLTPSDPDCTIQNEILNDFISFFPLPQGYIALKIAGYVRKNLDKLNTPCIAFLSKNDKDMNFSDQVKIIKQKTNLINIIQLDKSMHQITVDVEKNIVNAKTLDFLND